MGARKNVLVVDDEEDIQLLLCHVLRDAGFEVDSAWDGVQALEKILGAPPDLVVLDLMMPVLDGWAVLERLQGVPHPPVVVLSAYADCPRVLRLGAMACLSKPFRFHELLGMCHRLLAA